jgi:hypothetical protein
MPQMQTQTVYVNIGSSESRGRSYALEAFEDGLSAGPASCSLK